ncbi:MAG TPA: hypothetical protein VNJ53_13260 [Gaiellaceae bacterium]|nr:hypothetical protein [Gaiellaceae bacterium]
MSSKSQPVRGIVRQGDVLLVPVEELPAGGQERVVEGPRVVLAEGEATGHAHVVLGKARLVHSAARRSWREGGRRHLVVEEPATLVHEEHHAIGLLPGVYEVRRQREYTPPVRERARSFRWVAD